MGVLRKSEKGILEQFCEQEFPSLLDAVREMSRKSLEQHWSHELVTEVRRKLAEKYKDRLKQKVG